jgi:sugar/nucleoside kinase (ribokinase family)
MGRSRRGFVTGGCWCVDRNRTIPFWPKEDMSVLTSAPIMRGGGSACNFAIDIRRLDPQMWVETIGLVGDDQEGRFLRAEATRYGIGTTGLKTTSDAPTHSTDAFQSLESGRRTHIFHDGTSGLLSPDCFRFEDTSGSVLHLGLPGVHARMDAPWQGDPNGWVTVLRQAQAAGLSTNLELVTVSADRLAALAVPCLPHLDTLIVNDFEIGAIAGIKTTDDHATEVDACKRAARQVLERGSMEVVVVHFVGGAILVARDGTLLFKPSVNVPPEAFKGANGAGDAFAAGFLLARHDNRDFESALTLAHATAAACLRSITTVDSVGSVSECLDLAASWGWR